MTLKKYESYKDTGVEWIGEVPEHWDVSNLGYRSTMIVPMRDKPTEFNGNIPWIRIEDVNDMYIDDTLSEQRVTPELVKEMNLKVFPVGTVLCTCSCNMGTTAIVNAPLISNQTFIGIVPKENLNSEYLFYLMKANKDRLQFISQGAIQQYLSRHDFEHLKLAFPTIQEQYQIANYLTSKVGGIDELISLKNKMLLNLQEQRQAIITEAVTKGLNPNVKMKDSGVEWIGEVPEHWRVVSLQRISTKITNGYVGPTRDILVDEPGTRYIQSLHVKNGKIIFDRKPYYVDEAWAKQHKKSTLKEGNLLFVQTGDIGQVAVVPREFEGCNCHALIIVEFNHEIGNGYYYSYYFQSGVGRQQLISIKTGALHPHLDCGVLKFVKVVVPPISEQMEIYNYLLKEDLRIRELIEDIKNQIEQLQEYKQSLIYEVVTGKIDVREFAKVEKV